MYDTSQALRALRSCCVLHLPNVEMVIDKKSMHNNVSEAPTTLTHTLTNTPIPLTCHEYMRRLVWGFMLGSCVLSHQAIVAAMMHHNRSAAVQEAAIGAVVALSCESAASRVQAAAPCTHSHDARTVTIHTDAAWQYPWVHTKEPCVVWSRPVSRPTTGQLLSAATLTHACVVHHR